MQKQGLGYVPAGCPRSRGGAPSPERQDQEPLVDITCVLEAMERDTGLERLQA